MRKVLSPAVLFALLAVAVTGIALAAGEPTSRSHHGRLHVIRVHRVPGEQKILDLDQSATASKPAPVMRYLRAET